MDTGDQNQPHVAGVVAESNLSDCVIPLRGVEMRFLRGRLPKPARVCPASRQKHSGSIKRRRVRSGPTRPSTGAKTSDRARHPRSDGPCGSQPSTKDPLTLRNFTSQRPGKRTQTMVRSHRSATRMDKHSGHRSCARGRWMRRSDGRTREWGERRERASRPREMTQVGSSHKVLKVSMPSILKRHGRVMCAQCGASHPVIFEGQQCLICGSTIDVPNRRHDEADTVVPDDVGTAVPDDVGTAVPDDVGTAVPEDHEVENEYTTQSAALDAERAELRATLAALSRQDLVSPSDCERYVKVAAKGMARRDNYPIPRSVTTQQAFYEIMAGAALDAIDFPALLGRLERANRQLQITQEILRLAEANSEDSRTGGD
jgi:hypothetical protein